MKRFDDFIRLLLSFLISELFRRADEISEALAAFFHPAVDTPPAGVIAFTTPYILSLLYLRNIHASMLFDRRAEEANYGNWLEKTRMGCFLTMLLSQLALFWLPYASAHLLTQHLGVPHVKVTLPLLLLSPFVLYFFWDMLLVFKKPALFTAEAKQLDTVVARWLTIESVGAIAFIFTAVVTIWGQNTPWAVDSEELVGVFILVVLGTVVADYAWNNTFYFAPRSISANAIAARQPPLAIGPELSDVQPPCIPAPVEATVDAVPASGRLASG
jgi:hypothetical protein